MDEAAWRFTTINKPDGIIVCLDADCTVERNYLTAVENHFQQNPKTYGCLIYFEHPLEGDDYDEKFILPLLTMNCSFAITSSPSIGQAFRIPITR